MEGGSQATGGVEVRPHARIAHILTGCLVAACLAGGQALAVEAMPDLSAAAQAGGRQTPAPGDQAPPADRPKTPDGPVPDVTRDQVRMPTATESDAAEDSFRHVDRPMELTPGEKLVYEIKWSGVPAGQTTLSVKWKREFDGAYAYHIEGRTRSNKFVGMFYDVDDEIITIVDAKGGFSRFFKMVKREERTRENEKIRFDYEKNLAVYEQEMPGPFERKSRRLVRIDGHVQDPFSCLYYLRTTLLVPGQSLVMPVHTARREWALTVDVLRREEIVVPRFGKLNALRLEPGMSFPGIFVRKGRMAVWVEETTHIPVLMHVDIPIGSVTVTLTDAENSPLVPAEGAAPADEAGEAAEVYE